ncbi:18620_t:CDS:1 [Acaulospora morrowiae]|uniref:18620_t:CDS:1 n=1 Tax=Acaulospora morrowiae TaxID=94023 RepID=A0A9N9H3Y2_9GLOM|nr:18620_t:CDS:1 [Acaulospora morrowiae]
MSDITSDFRINTQEDINFEIPLSNKSNNIVYFPQLVKQSEPINSQSRYWDNCLEEEETLEELVIKETAEFLESLADEKRPDSAFYAISRPGTAPGLFGAGSLQPPETIYKFFKYNSPMKEATEVKNNSVTKVTKPRTRKNPVVPSNKSKGKRSIKHEFSSNEDKIEGDKEHVKKSSKRQLIEAKSKKRTNKPKHSECLIPSKKEIGIMEKVQRIIEKHKRRKELKEKRNIIKDGVNNVIGSSSSKNTPTKTNKMKKGIDESSSIDSPSSKNALTKTVKTKRDFDDSSISSMSSSSSESSPKRKRKPDRFSGSSSTSSTVKSAKTSSLKKRSKKNHGNDESESSTGKAILSSDSTV